MAFDFPNLRKLKYNADKMKALADSNNPDTELSFKTNTSVGKLVLQKIDYLRSNKYTVAISPIGASGNPSLDISALNQILKSKNDMLINSIIKVNLPDTSYDTHSYVSYGKQWEFPHRRLYGTKFDITVLNDSNSANMNFFHTWHDAMIDRTSGRLEYPNNYLADTIEIVEYNNKGDAAQMWVFYKCYPVTIGAPALSYETQNTIQDFNVTFNFVEYEYISASTLKQ